MYRRYVGEKVPNLIDCIPYENTYAWRKCKVCACREYVLQSPRRAFAKYKTRALYVWIINNIRCEETLNRQVCYKVNRELTAIATQQQDTLIDAFGPNLLFVVYIYSNIITNYFKNFVARDKCVVKYYIAKNNRAPILYVLKNDKTRYSQGSKIILIIIGLIGKKIW